MKKLLFVFFILLISGCWNYRELNDLAIVTSIAIDKKNNNYEVSALIINNKESSTIYSSGGKTIAQALKKINLKIPKELYLGHLETIIISEDVAHEGIKNTLDYLLRNPETIKQFYLIVAKNAKANEVIKASSPLESFSGQSINSSVTSSSDIQGIKANIEYNKFIENMLKKGKEETLPTITLKDKKIKLDTISIFKNGRLLGYTNSSESQGINIILNQIDETYLSYKCNNGYVTSNISNIKTRIKNYFKNKKPYIYIWVKADATIDEITCFTNLDNKKYIKKNIKRKLTKELKQGIKIAKKYKSDVFGFGNLFYKKYPTYFKNVEQKWNEKVFPNIPIDIKVTITLKNTGSTKKTLKGDYYD